jgi:hypothetical protein
VFVMFVLRVHDLDQSYEPRYYYMEIVGLGYRLIMSAVVVLFLPETAAQVGYLLLHWMSTRASPTPPPRR